MVKSYRNPNIEVELTWGAVVSAGLGVKTAQKPSVAILMLIPQLSHTGECIGHYDGNGSHLHK